jgi:CRP-like cAMP-binding protein
LERFGDQATVSATDDRSLAPGEDRLAALRTAPIFRDLPEPALHAIAGRCRFRQLTRGAFVFFEGRPADAVHLLLSGHVKVVRETGDGQEVILRLIQPGEIFGGAGGWGEPVYPATGVTIDDSTILQLPAADFTALVAEQPDFALLMIRELGLRLREAEARIRELQAERAERRIARSLLRLVSKTGTRTSAGIEIGVPLSRQHLAELAGTTISTASRILSNWDRQGLIIAGRERVTIVKPHRLVMIADELGGDERPTSG